MSCLMSMLVEVNEIKKKATQDNSHPYYVIFVRKSIFFADNASQKRIRLESIETKTKGARETFLKPASPLQTQERIELYSSIAL